MFALEEPKKAPGVAKGRNSAGGQGVEEACERGKRPGRKVRTTRKDLLRARERKLKSRKENSGRKGKRKSSEGRKKSSPSVPSCPGKREKKVKEALRKP